MSMFKRVLAAAAVLVGTGVVPGTMPSAMATHCTGSNTFVAGTPVAAVSNPVGITATFLTQGPGYTPQECDLGWMVSCQIWVDGQPVSTQCSTHYTPEPDRCPVDTPCGVDVTASVPMTNGTHTVKAELRMQWGCCGFRGGPIATATGEWLVVKTSGGQCTNDVCQKVRPIIKISGHDPFDD